MQCYRDNKACNLAQLAPYLSYALLGALALWFVGI